MCVTHTDCIIQFIMYPILVRWSLFKKCILTLGIVHVDRTEYVSGSKKWVGSDLHPPPPPASHAVVTVTESPRKLVPPSPQGRARSCLIREHVCKPARPVQPVIQAVLSFREWPPSYYYTTYYDYYNHTTVHSWYHHLDQLDAHTHRRQHAYGCTLSSRRHGCSGYIVHLSVLCCAID